MVTALMGRGWTMEASGIGESIRVKPKCSSLWICCCCCWSMLVALCETSRVLLSASSSADSDTSSHVKFAGMESLNGNSFGPLKSRLTSGSCSNVDHCVCERS